LTSPDGLLWSEQANPKNFYLHCVVWASQLGLFVAVGQADGGDAYIVTSPDGVTWTERANPANKFLFAVTWDGSLLVAAGESTGTSPYIITSSDGVTWTQRTFALNEMGIGLAFGAGLFCLATSTRMLTSPDGITWTQRANFSPSGIISLTWSGDRFVGVGAAVVGTPGLAFVRVSVDGLTWSGTGVTLPSGLPELYAVSWSGMIFVAAGRWSTPAQRLALATSRNGFNWTWRDSLSGHDLLGLAWNGRRFVAVGSINGTQAVLFTSLTR
jgi:hypothetical protein